MLTPEEFLELMNRALSDMTKTIEALGDERVNQRPDIPDANSPYIILSHCVGLTHYWIGRLCAGRAYLRDRDGEFSAQGDVATLSQAVRDLQAQLSDDIQRVRFDQPIVGELDDRHADLVGITQGQVMLRCFKELAQHHGHMDLTRDLLLQR